MVDNNWHSTQLHIPLFANCTIFDNKIVLFTIAYLVKKNIA